MVDVYPMGLINFNGSACWLNSLIQSLMGSKTINDIILHPKNDNTSKTFLEYYNIISKVSVNNNNNNSNNEYKIMELSQVMNSLCDDSIHLYNLMNQNDPTEFLLIFIEKLGKECINATNYAVQKSILCNNHTHNKREENILMSVSLSNIGELQKYLNKHIEDIEYKCDAETITNNITNTIIKKPMVVTRLSRVPQVLIIMIKNYHENYSGKIINYPNILEFPTNNNKKWILNVVSVIEHHGSKNINTIIRGGSGGHYVCTSHRHDGIYYFNDSNVTRTTTFPKNNNICTIVYERTLL